MRASPQSSTGLPVTGWSAPANLINAPLLSFEVSQAGYGMYVKYLMAGFLMVYAVSMLVQFMSQFLSASAVLLGEAEPEEEPAAAAGGAA